MCVLLFFSITVFSSGMGLVEVFVGGTEAANPYPPPLEAAVWYGPDGSKTLLVGQPAWSAAPRWRPRHRSACPRRKLTTGIWPPPLQEAAPELWAETVGAFAQVSAYSAPDMTYDPLVAAAEATGVDPSTLRLDDLGSVRTTHLTVVSLSDFNGARAPYKARIPWNWQRAPAPWRTTWTW